MLIGVLGFALPAGTSPTSAEPAYNIFHICFGVIGLILVIFRYENPIRLFNIVFGLLDLYQAAASFTDAFPEQYFKWTTVDDVLHLVIGTALVLVGLYGFVPVRKIYESLN